MAKQAPTNVPKEVKKTVLIEMAYKIVPITSLVFEAKNQTRPGKSLINALRYQSTF